jgi:N-acetylneuraminic acid mutarotase
MKKYSLIMFLAMALFACAFISCENEATTILDTKETLYKNKTADVILDLENTPVNFDLKAGAGKWTTVAPIPSPTEGASVAAVDNFVVVAMGFSDFGDSDFTRIYDIENDTWSMGSSAPAFSSEGAGTSHGGLFYSVGGRGGAFQGLFSYDMYNDVWSVLPNMPTGRAGLGVVTVGNDIYAIGGRSLTGGPNSGGVLDVVEKYDIAAGTWTTMAPMLFPRSDIAAVAHGGKIYVLGGFNAQGVPMAAVDVYDPVTDTWSNTPSNMPTARGALYGAGIKGGTIFAIGGWDGVYPFPNAAGYIVESYKISKDKWTTGYTPMPTARGEAGVASHGGLIYLVGGGTPAYGLPIASVEVFKP